MGAVTSLLQNSELVIYAPLILIVYDIFKFMPFFGKNV
jgi:hypothetical protein